jgi:hypothetical protein
MLIEIGIKFDPDPFDLRSRLIEPGPFDCEDFMGDYPRDSPQTAPERVDVLF